MFRLGLIINPYSGIGGAIALKGSDGAEIRQKALAAGAEKKSQSRTLLALEALADIKTQFCVITASGEMGEDACNQLGLQHQVVYYCQNQQTEATDTVNAVAQLLEQKIDLLLFAGGDGTAIDICQQVQDKLPVLGIPAGCKIHSGVYAITPQAAGKVLASVIKGELVSLMSAEVRDIDEDKFRQGVVVAKHFGEMLVPEELTYIQAVKMGGKESDELLLSDIAAYVQELMQEYDDHIFVMGSGSTIDFVMQDIGYENTLLGVDLVYQNQLLAQDVTADQLVKLTQDKPVKLVITLIGGQGHIIGRGNQQLSNKFLARLNKNDIYLVATKAKLQSLGQKGLIVDSGDPDLDASLAGPIPVITGYKDQVLYFVRGD
ncbi:ATP-NAD kinase family protein [Glaciecola sp. 1036]|uniref:ATP-NAD kinase family protein n=1 Tax=Alteromonadaceae TaxID=72275 RepID=UPI003D07FA1F